MRAGTTALSIIAATLLLGAALPAHEAHAGIELARTNPAHLGPPARWPLDPAYAPQPPRFESPGMVVVTRSDQPVAKVATLEPKLSELCRYNLFHQRRDGWLNAVFADRTLAAAYGSGLGLYDPGGAANPNRLYLFIQAASTACEVRSMPDPNPRSARAGG